MKQLTLSTLIIAAILLAACSSSSSGTSTASTSNDLPIETQMAVGTLKLGGTDQDITVEQARDLLVYWEVYRDLSQSQTAAQAELDGLVAQIQETMTDAQMQAIADMQITQGDVLKSARGVAVAASSSNNRMVSIPSGSTSAGGMPAGGPPADGGGAPPDGGMPADMSAAAASASGANQTRSAQTDSSVTTEVPSALVEALIQSLQQKIAA